MAPARILLAPANDAHPPRPGGAWGRVFAEAGTDPFLLKLAYIGWDEGMTVPEFIRMVRYALAASRERRP